MIQYSFVVPAYNEEEALPYFFEEAVAVMDRMDGECELIFVNDGSSDRTESLIAGFVERDRRVKGVSFSRNFGQESAFLCGLRLAKGQAVITLDADLQDPPRLALLLSEKWREGYEVVHAQYRKRLGESVLKKLTSHCYYRVLNGLTGLDVPVDCSSLKLFDRKVVDAILSLPEQTRFLRTQTAWVGFRQTVISFDRSARVAGKTKYSLAKMFALAEKGILPNSEKPAKLSSRLGGLLVVGSLATYLTFAVLSFFGVGFGGLTAWIFPTVTLCTGILLLNSGIQNAYLMRIYAEEKSRPPYIVSRTFNMEEKE